MHEYGLAQDVVERLKAEAARAGARRIIAVDIEVGGLSHTSAEHLAFWIREALGEGLGRDATVRVLRASPSLFCQDCQQRSSQSPPADDEWDAYSLPARCPHCGSARVQLEGDTGCLIRHLELERKDVAPEDRDPGSRARGRLPPLRLPPGERERPGGLGQEQPPGCLH